MATLRPEVVSYPTATTETLAWHRAALIAVTVCPCIVAAGLQSGISDRCHAIWRSTSDPASIDLDDVPSLCRCYLAARMTACSQAQRGGSPMLASLAHKLARIRVRPDIDFSVKMQIVPLVTWSPFGAAVGVVATITAPFAMILSGEQCRLDLHVEALAESGRWEAAGPVSINDCQRNCGIDGAERFHHFLGHCPVAIADNGKILRLRLDLLGDRPPAYSESFYRVVFEEGVEVETPSRLPDLSSNAGARGAVPPTDVSAPTSPPSVRPRRRKRITNRDRGNRPRGPVRSPSAPTPASPRHSESLPGAAPEHHFVAEMQPKLVDKTTVPPEYLGAPQLMAAGYRD